MRMLSIILTFTALSCATNNYRDYYSDQTNGLDLRELHFAVGLLEDGEEPTIRYGTADLEADILAMREEGYLMIGYSHFNAANAPEAHLVSQAKKVRATNVISYQQYTETVSGSTTLVLPGIPQQQTTYHSGSIYGSGGHASYSGTSTTTVPGQSTVTSIPYTIHRYDFLATYWVRSGKPAFGVNLGRLSDQTRRRLGTNRGCEVMVVLNETNAYYADVLRGDVLISVDRKAVNSVDECLEAIAGSRGRTVQMVFLRGDERREIRVPVDQPAEWE